MSKISTFYSNILIRTRLAALVALFAMFLFWIIYLSAKILFIDPEDKIERINLASLKAHHITRIHIELDIVVSHERHQILRQTEESSRNKISRINYSIIEKQIQELGVLLLDKQENAIYDNIVKHLSELKSTHFKINNFVFRDEQDLARKLNSKEFDPILTEIRDDLFKLLNFGSEQRRDSNQGLKNVLSSGFMWIVVSIILFLIVITTLVLVVSHEIEAGLLATNRQLEQLNSGVLSNNLLIEGYSELGQLNLLVNKTTQLFVQVCKFLDLQLDGVNSEFKQQGDLDKIGMVLNGLNLKLAKQRETEQEQQHQSSYNEWVFKGIRRFNDVLTELAPNEKVLSQKVIAILIDYLDVPIAGFYTTISENGETYLRLDATYAYEKRKLYNKLIAAGEGLIGAAYVEKQMSIHSNIPPNYFLIASGMGYAAPRRLLILPLIHNDVVVGVIEIAGFHDFEDKKISLLEQVAPNIAVSLSTVTETADNTNLLLKNKQYINTLLKREDDYRKRIKKLNLDNNEHEHKIEELQRYTTAIESNTIIVELNGNGQILSFNNKFQRLTKFEPASLQKTKFVNFIANLDEVTIISNGTPSRKQTQERLVLYDRNKQTIPIIASLNWSTIYHDRVFLIAVEVTEFNNNYEKLRRIVKELKLETVRLKKELSEVVVEKEVEDFKKSKVSKVVGFLSKVIAFASFDLHWNIIDWNSSFLREVGIAEDSVGEFNCKSLFDENDFDDGIEQSLRQGVERKLVVEIACGTGSMKWFQLYFLPIFNTNKKIEQYFVRFQNINYWHKNELLAEGQMLELDKRESHIAELQASLEKKHTFETEVFKRTKREYEKKIEVLDQKCESLVNEFEIQKEQLNNDKRVHLSEMHKLKLKFEHSGTQKVTDLESVLDKVRRELELIQNEKEGLENKLSEADIELSSYKDQKEYEENNDTEKISVWLGKIKSNLIN